MHQGKGGVTRSHLKRSNTWHSSYAKPIFDFGTYNKRIGGVSLGCFMLRTRGAYLKASLVWSTLRRSTKSAVATRSGCSHGGGKLYSLSVARQHPSAQFLDQILGYLARLRRGGDRRARGTERAAVLFDLLGVKKDVGGRVRGATYAQFFFHFFFPSASVPVRACARAPVYACGRVSVHAAGLRANEPSTWILRVLDGGCYRCKVARLRSWQSSTRTHHASGYRRKGCKAYVSVRRAACGVRRVDGSSRQCVQRTCTVLAPA